MEWKSRPYRYLWTALTGWAVAIVSGLLNHVAIFWIGGIAGIVLGIATIILSVSEMNKGIKHIVVHGIAWTLAVALIFMCGMWMYAVSSGV